jgi:hypothetical protein
MMGRPCDLEAEAFERPLQQNNIVMWIRETANVTAVGLIADEKGDALLILRKCKRPATAIEFWQLLPAPTPRAPPMDPAPL